MDDTIAFIEAREQDGAEVNRPDAIVDFFEADMVRVEGGGEVQQSGLKADCARIGHALHQEVARVFERRQLRRIGAR